MKDEKSEEEYVPWGHLLNWPQWLRMALLGEGPVFNLPIEIARWDTLTDEVKAKVRQDNPTQIGKRKETLKNLQEAVKVCLTVAGVLFGGIVFAFAQRPQGAAGGLALICAASIALAVILLLRAIIPAPHSLRTDFDHPFTWVDKSKTAQHPDVEFIANDYSHLLELNALVQFIKRLVIWAAILAALGLVAYVGFLVVWL